MNKTETKERLDVLLKTFKENNLAYVNAKSSKVQVEQRLDKIKSEIVGSVASDATFTNEKQRGAEIMKRLSDNIEYTQLSEVLEGLKGTMDSALLQIDNSKEEMRNIRALILLETIDEV
jgi:hypothetical protein